MADLESALAKENLFATLSAKKGNESDSDDEAPRKGQLPRKPLAPRKDADESDSSDDDGTIQIRQKKPPKKKVQSKQPSSARAVPGQIGKKKKRLRSVETSESDEEEGTQEQPEVDSEEENVPVRKKKKATAKGREVVTALENESSEEEASAKLTRKKKKTPRTEGKGKGRHHEFRHSLMKEAKEKPQRKEKKLSKPQAPEEIDEEEFYLEQLDKELDDEGKGEGSSDEEGSKAANDDEAIGETEQKEKEPKKKISKRELEKQRKMHFAEIQKQRRSLVSFPSREDTQRDLLKETIKAELKSHLSNERTRRSEAPTKVSSNEQSAAGTSDCLPSSEQAISATSSDIPTQESAEKNPQAYNVTGAAEECVQSSSEVGNAAKAIEVGPEGKGENWPSSGQRDRDENEDTLEDTVESEEEKEDLELTAEMKVALLQQQKFRKEQEKEKSRLLAKLRGCAAKVATPSTTQIENAVKSRERGNASHGTSRRGLVFLAKLGSSKDSSKSTTLYLSDDDEEEATPALRLSLTTENDGKEQNPQKQNVERVQDQPSVTAGDRQSEQSKSHEESSLSAAAKGDTKRNDSSCANNASQDNGKQNGVTSAQNSSSRQNKLEMKRSSAKAIYEIFERMRKKAVDSDTTTSPEAAKFDTIAETRTDPSEMGKEQSTAPENLGHSMENARVSESQTQKAAASGTLEVETKKSETMDNDKEVESDMVDEEEGMRDITAPTWMDLLTGLGTGDLFERKKKNSKPKKKKPKFYDIEAGEEDEQGEEIEDDDEEDDGDDDGEDLEGFVVEEANKDNIDDDEDETDELQVMASLMRELEEKMDREQTKKIIKSVESKMFGRRKKAQRGVRALEEDNDDSDEEYLDTEDPFMHRLQSMKVLARIERARSRAQEILDGQDEESESEADDDEEIIARKKRYEKTVLLRQMELEEENEMDHLSEELSRFSQGSLFNMRKTSQDLSQSSRPSSALSRLDQPLGMLRQSTKRSLDMEAPTLKTGSSSSQPLMRPLASPRTATPPVTPTSQQRGLFGSLGRGAEPVRYFKRTVSSSFVLDDSERKTILESSSSLGLSHGGESRHAKSSGAVVFTLKKKTEISSSSDFLQTPSTKAPPTTDSGKPARKKARRATESDTGIGGGLFSLLGK